MRTQQTLTFLVPAKEAERVVAAVRANFANALIGRKPLESDAILLAVTLYADEAEGLIPVYTKLGLDAVDLGGQRPHERSLAALVEEIQRKQA